MSNPNSAPDGLSPKEVETLRTFSHQFGVLTSLKLYNSRPSEIGVNVKISEKGTKVGSESIGHDEDDFRSLLASLRQFHLPSESISMEKVCKLIIDKCQRPNLVAWTKAAMAKWKHELIRPTLPEYTFDSRVYSLDDALKLLLYGGVIHSDADKVARLQSMAVGPQTLRFFVHRASPKLGDALHNVDAVISHWLDRPQEDPGPPTSTTG